MMMMRAHIGWFTFQQESPRAIVAELGVACHWTRKRLHQMAHQHERCSSLDASHESSSCGGGRCLRLRRIALVVFPLREAA